MVAMVVMVLLVLLALLLVVVLVLHAQPGRRLQMQWGGGEAQGGPPHGRHPEQHWAPRAPWLLAQQQRPPPSCRPSLPPSSSLHPRGCTWL